MLHLAYPLFISSFFLFLMLSAGRGRLVLVRGGMRVEDSYIKKLDSQKLNGILCEPCSYYCYKMAPEAIPKHLISKNFLGGACPQTPLVLHPYACIHATRHPCNPPSKNPGYGPASCYNFISKSSFSVVRL